MTTILRLLALILLNATTVYECIWNLGSIAGYSFVFKKCGLPFWHAFIPCWREYALAKCADCEAEGKSLLICEIFSLCYSVFCQFRQITSEMILMTDVILLLVLLFAYLQKIRIYIGLATIFGRKKRAAILWLFPKPITSLVWGLSAKYQPQWTVSDFQHKVDTFFSGHSAEVLENGLTVNIEDRSVFENFSRKYLLRDIHFSIAPGHMVLLLGGSGAGKTTLLNAITGYEKANAKILLNGTDLYANYKKMMYEVGFVPQQDLMRGNDTVLSTLVDAATLRLPGSFSKAELRERVNTVMEDFGLTPLKDSLVSKLSGGQRKRLSIAMEYISNPTLFILDEPDSGLDGVMSRSLMQHLRSIADQGKIVIVITHTPDRSIDLFDDVIVLAKDSNRSGRLSFFGPVERSREFFDRPSMEQVVRTINSKSDGGEGRADEFVKRFAEEVSA